MFENELQSSPLSLFSSIGSDPLGLFRAVIDLTLPKDSHISLVEDSTEQPEPSLHGDEEISVECLDHLTLEDVDYSSSPIVHQVLHIQSPTLPSTFIRAPALDTVRLGIKLSWMHLYVRNLGKPWAVEVGFRDSSGTTASFRCCTFQVNLHYAL